jgi:hypothetical protein
VVVWPQEVGKYLEYPPRVKLLIAGGRDVADIVEASEKERIEVVEAQLAEHAHKKGQVRV